MPQHPQAALFAKKGLFKELNSFQELEERISQIEEDKAKGDAFEVFVEAYLATQRKHEAQTIWPNQVAPLDLLERLGLTSSDYGVDGLYLTPVGQYNAYQAKFRTGRPGLTWRELSTFMGLADSRNLHNRVLITNCEELPDLLNQRDNFFCISGTDLDRLDKEALHEISSWLEGSVFEKPKKNPRPHQQEAITKILEEFSQADRATAVMACGTGKTLVGLWVMEALQPKKALILMPSLALIRQTLHEWLQETKIKNFSFLCVCSDQSVSEGTDSLVINQSDLDFEVTTDAKRVREYLNLPFEGTKVVFTTYHSAPVVGDAIGQEGSFDYAVFDEAHKTAGKRDRRTGFALDNKNIQIGKRLFLTATPRRFNLFKQDQDGEAEEVLSMENENAYGKRIFTLSFGRAVADKIICPYEVIISVITTEMVTNAMLEHGETKVGNDQVMAKHVANQIAVRDAIRKHGVKKVFTFHSTVKSASDFAGKGVLGIKTHLPECSVYHVNGKMASNVREKLMKGFAQEGLALMSNARCLTEGVDVPAVDMVAFLAPKKSQIDIIQAAGRAMRVAEGKQTGFILVPLFVEQKKGESVPSAVARADFLEVWEVLQSLQEQDDVLADIISTFGSHSPTKKRAVISSGYRRRIQILAPNIPQKDIEEAIIAKSLGKLTTAWSQRYSELQAFYNEHMHCNIEYLDFKFQDDVILSKWLKRQRMLFKQGKLLPERVKKLSEIGIIWDYKPHKKDKDWRIWEKNFYSLTQHKRRHNTLIPNTSSLLNWTERMRQGLAKNKLPDYQVKLLTCIGLKPAEESGDWENNFRRLQMWWLNNKNHKILSPKIDPTLGRWAKAQRESRNKGQMDEKRIELLNGIKFPWANERIAEPAETDTWIETYENLKKWWKVRKNYFSPHMQSHLKEWAKEQSAKKKAGELPNDKIALLDQIEFPWDRY